MRPSVADAGRQSDDDLFDRVGSDEDEDFDCQYRSSETLSRATLSEQLTYRPSWDRPSVEDADPSNPHIDDRFNP